MLTAVLALGPGLTESYTNARFGYTARYPSFLNARPEPDNGDGRVFVSRDGRRSLRVWGGYNVVYKTPAEEVASFKRTRYDYKVVKPDFYVLSWRNGGTTGYQRFWYRGEVRSGFLLKYAAGDKEMEGLIGPITKAFRPAKV